MEIRAKTKLFDRELIIVDFVVKYDKTYAVAIDAKGEISTWHIEDLIVINPR